MSIVHLHSQVRGWVRVRARVTVRVRASDGFHNSSIIRLQSQARGRVRLRVRARG